MPYFNTFRINTTHLLRINNERLRRLDSFDRRDETNIKEYNKWKNHIKKQCDKLTTTFNIEYFEEEKFEKV